jgi:hypothetical protein
MEGFSCDNLLHLCSTIRYSTHTTTPSSRQYSVIYIHLLLLDDFYYAFFFISVLLTLALSFFFVSILFHTIFYVFLTSMQFLTLTVQKH